MQNNYPIASSDHLTIRLAHAVKSGQRVTFLVGSGLTCPCPNGKERGVPGANAMVHRVRDLFSSPEERELFETTLDSVSEGKRYQAAMQFVIECRGQTALNSLIRDAVIEARLAPLCGMPLDDMERDLSGWSLRPGVAALGMLVSRYPKVFQRPILTSNFDPLIEIAIQRAGRGALTINLPNDGNFSGLIVNENIAQIVHFHGFWRDGDTLHTPDRLSRERPLLAGNLRRLLQETVLVVVGYGGWKDVFTDALVKAISEQSQVLDVLWGFYSNDVREIKQKHSELLESFHSLPGQRVVTYSGVDCHELFPKLLKSLEASGAASAIIRIPVSEPVNGATFAMRSSSSLPTTEAWVGRGEEIRSLMDARHSVIALHGLGGFGKSSLAAKYLTEREQKRDIKSWYWADCREQGNTIQTHLINILDYITQGEVGAHTLQKATDQDILDLFFERLKNQRAVIVFDNIDHYVDLETQKSIGIMNQLIERALSSSLDSQLVITSRPELQYQSSAFLSLLVPGLDVPDVERLFQLRGAGWVEERKHEQINAVLRLTQGSALRLNLIATQVAKQKIPIEELLQRIENGTAPEAEDRIFYEIWGTLKDDHQRVLRVLAELPHPESEARVATCVSDSMTFNKFGKAIRSLKGLNLVVVKPNPDGDVLELHPLVRAFIRKRYAKDEQEPIIDQVIGFFTRMMGRSRGKPEMATIAVLGNWIAMVEICVENGRDSEALEAFYEIHNTLLAKGFCEEFLRLATMVVGNFQVKENPAELKKFDRVAERMVDVLGDFGRYSEADQWIEKLAGTVVGKSARYIWLCQVRAYAFWIRGKFDEAKACAAEGFGLKSSSNMDTAYDCGHTLALAQRDSGDVDKALGYFLEGEKLEVVLDAKHMVKERGGAYYGNIGRCLQFLNRNEEALICLRKSACLLENEEHGNSMLNRGWAALWLGEVLEKKKMADQAYLAFRSASAKFKFVSPGRAREAGQKAEALKPSLHDGSLASCGDWECEEMYRNWLHV